MEGAEQAGVTSVSSKPTQDTAPTPHSQPTEDTAPTPHSQPTEDTAPTPHSQPTEDTAPTPHSQPTKDTAPTPHSQPTEDTAPTPHSQPTEDTAPTPHSQPTEDTAPTPHSQPTEDTAPTPHSLPTEDTAPTPHSKPTEDTAPTPLPESNNISNHTDKAHSPTDNSTSQITIETEASEDLPQMSNRPIVIQGSNKNPASEKLQRVRTWSITKYKVTRQALAERLGRGSKTVDLDLEPRMELLKDDRQRYDHMTKLAQTLATQITQLSVTQKALGDVFADLSIKTPALHAQFGLNAKAQRYLSKSGDTLSEAVNSFTSDMNTLVNKTIEDTMFNAKQYEAVRIEYDAYRVDLEELNLGPRDTVTVPKLEQAQTSFQLQRERYERSRNDLSVKLKLLEENKVKVLHNHLWLLHNAMASHCLNCHRFLQNNMQHAQNMSCPTEDAPSWLEDS
uniref:AH domain-containing protein n=1 Tax=Neogobius melanostomus TaxID=47308 RepID=A0A8C6TSS6_9GOBI